MPLAEHVNYREFSVFFNVSDYSGWLQDSMEWGIHPTIRPYHVLNPWTWIPELEVSPCLYTIYWWVIGGLLAPGCGLCQSSQERPMQKYGSLQVCSMTAGLTQTSECSEGPGVTLVLRILSLALASHQVLLISQLVSVLRKYVQDVRGMVWCACR